MHVRSVPLLTLRTVATLLLVLAASCTSEPERPDLPDVNIDVPADPSTAVPSDGPAPTPGSKIDGLPGRLAVLDPAGNLMTVNPDGSDEIVIAEAEPGRSEIRQPTWSPDGDVDQAVARARAFHPAANRGRIDRLRGAASCPSNRS